MIKSNWPIKNLIMLSDLIFMQIRPIIIGHNGVQLSLNLVQKLQLDFPACFLHVANLYFIFYFEKKWILRKNRELGYDNHVLASIHLVYVRIPGKGITMYWLVYI